MSFMLIICLSTKNKLLDRHFPWKFLRFCQKLQVSEIIPQFWHPILLLKNCTNLIKHRTFLWEIQTILKKVSTFYRDHENEKRWLWFFFSFVWFLKYYRTSKWDFFRNTLKSNLFSFLSTTVFILRLLKRFMHWLS